MPVKIKVFAVVMAVMCLMSLTCTAFAAETDLPPGAQLLTNGAQVSTNDLTSLSTPYVISAQDVESITISGLFGFSSVYGWDGTQWVKLNVDNPADVTITVADYDYTYYTMLRGDTMASQTVTVKWVKVSLVKQAGDFVSGAFVHIGGPALGFITSHYLTIILPLLSLAGVAVLVVRKFVYGA